MLRFLLKLHRSSIASGTKEILHNLAAVMTARGHLEQAETYYRRTLGIQEKLFGEEDPGVALTRNNLGSLLIRAGGPGEAVPLLESTIRILEKSLMPGHPHLAFARNNLAKAKLPL